MDRRAWWATVHRVTKRCNLATKTTLSNALFFLCRSEFLVYIIFLFSDKLLTFLAKLVYWQQISSAYFSFTFEGVELVPGQSFDASALPAPLSVYQVPSCAIEGTDNVYNYGTIEVTAFNDGTGEVIYSVYIVDANTPTDEGLYIGDTVDYVMSVYGEDCVRENGQITYQKGDTLLILILDGDYVQSIDFRWDA